MNSTARKLFARACCAALGGFVLGLCFVRTSQHFDNLFLTGVILSGVFLVFVLFWTRRAVRPMATGETARKHATQFLWSCVFFSMLSFMFGMAVSGYTWFSSDFMRTFGVVFWGIMMAIAIYPVRRDTKRLADAAGPSQITSAQ